LIAVAVLVVGAALVVLAVRQLTGGAAWTGVVLDVPSCPSDAVGCRAFVIRAVDQQSLAPPVVAHVDWSGSATSLDVRIPAGSYAVALEGCAGYETAYSTFVVASGMHTSVAAGGGYWEMPKFPGRTCPGFHGMVGPPGYA
jgi:hypothetical protein